MTLGQLKEVLNAFEPKDDNLPVYLKSFSDYEDGELFTELDYVEKCGGYDPMYHSTGPTTIHIQLS